MKTVKLNAPIDKKSISKLRIGDRVYVSGIFYTARDASCKLLKNLLDGAKKLPIPLKNQIIYFVGPTPAVHCKAIGSCGPTTTSRMSKFIPMLFKNGLSAIVGKGRLPVDVKNSIKRFGGVYLLAVGGAGAILSQYVKKSKAVAFKKLGPEAIYCLEVKDFPVIVGVDSKGHDIYKTKTSLRRVKRG